MYVSELQFQFPYGLTKVTVALSAQKKLTLKIMEICQSYSKVFSFTFIQIYTENPMSK